jgi:hypothetical protein
MFHQTKITAIVPAAFDLNVARFESIVKASTKLGIKILLVHDIHDGQISTQIAELSPLQKTCNFTILEGQFDSPGLARNAGLNFVDCEWITFWDADDYPNLNNLISLLEHTIESNSNFGIGNFEVAKNFNTDEKSNVITISHGMNIKNVALNPGIWRMVIRFSRIKDLRFTNLLIGEDQIFFCQLKILNSEIYLSEISVYQYRTGAPQQLTSSKNAFLNLSTARNKVLQIYAETIEPDAKLLAAISYYRLLLTEFKSSWKVDSLRVKTKYRLLPSPWLISIYALTTIMKYSLQRRGKL